MKAVSVWILALWLTGCATSPAAFYKSPNSVSNASLCKAWINETQNVQFTRDMADEFTRRGLSVDQCRSVIDKQNGQVLLGAVAAAAVGYGIYALSKSGGGSGAACHGQDWDAFYNRLGQIEWQCRDVCNGQFVDSYRCAGLVRTDVRWPNK